MTGHIENSGFVMLGGTASISNSALGQGAVAHNVSPWQEDQRNPDLPGASVGVVTVLRVEATAVRDTLGLRPAPGDGPGTYLGTVSMAGRQVSVAMTRTLGQGEESATAAVARLRERYRPPVIVLAGIAGAIRSVLAMGDVVVATHVIQYDLRKETPAGTIRRGGEFRSPALASHATGQFLTDHGDPAVLGGLGGAAPFRVHHAPIGSGNAVVADRQSAIRSWLLDYNDKVAAVDMEAAGVATACHDDPYGSPPAWLVVRGISDDAGTGKNDDYHQPAAANAARTLSELLPYLSSAS